MKERVEKERGGSVKKHNNEIKQEVVKERVEKGRGEVKQKSKNAEFSFLRLA